MNFIRQYSLASEDGGIAWDKNYKLVFTRDGQMFVQSIKQYEQIYKTPEIKEILPSDFNKISVNGEILSEIVAKKLEEILPLEPRSAHSFL
jgi:hypothetical protein